MRTLTIPMRFGNYPNTLAPKSSNVKSAPVALTFVSEKTANLFFKCVVHDMEFDLAELVLAIVLQAKAYGISLVLLPIVIRGRLAQSAIACISERVHLGPGAALAGIVGLYRNSNPEARALRRSANLTRIPYHATALVFH